MEDELEYTEEFFVVELDGLEDKKNFLDNIDEYAVLGEEHLLIQLDSLIFKGKVENLFGTGILLKEDEHTGELTKDITVSKVWKGEQISAVRKDIMEKMDSEK